MKSFGLVLALAFFPVTAPLHSAEKSGLRAAAAAVDITLHHFFPSLLPATRQAAVSA